jgi:hypothetical protein
MVDVLANAPVVMSTHRLTERSEVRAEWVGITTGALAKLSDTSCVHLGGGSLQCP